MARVGAASTPRMRTARRQGEPDDSGTVTVEEGSETSGGDTAAEGRARRAPGALEAEILDLLWRCGGALTPSDVQQRLVDTGSTLSYSTVVTILTRLHTKGALARRRDGRAFRYHPLADRAGLAARSMRRLLDRQADRDSVLTHFVSDLSDRDEQLLRRLLSPDQGPSGRDG